MSNQPPSPLKSTVSAMLFLQTIAVFIILILVYCYWYSPRPGSSTLQWKELIVSPEDNLQQIVQTISEYTVLLLEPSVRQENIRITNKANLIVKGKARPEQTIIECDTEVPLVLQDCKNCSVTNVTLRSKSPQHPALRVIHGQKLVFDNLLAETVATAIEVQIDSYDISFRKNQVKGSVVVSDSRRIALVENVVLVDPSNSSGLSVDIRNVCQILLEKNKIKGPDGIRMQETTAEKNYKNCIFVNELTFSRLALALEKSSDFLITANTIEAKEVGPAISLKKCSNIQLGKPDLENKVKATTRSAVDIAGSNDITLLANWLSSRDDTVSTLQMFASNRLAVSRNEILGFVPPEETMNLSKVVGGGVSIDNCGEVVMKNNRLYNGLHNGIHIRNQSTVNISQNMIEGLRADDGISVEDNSYFKIGPGNTISGNIRGIYCKDSPGEIAENTLTKNQKEGIFLYNSSPKIYKNKISENGSNGLSAEKNSNPELEQNEFMGNHGYGIEFSPPRLGQWRQRNLFQNNHKGDWNAP